MSSSTSQNNVYIANAAHWSGFYAARSILGTKTFQKVVAGVHDRNSEYARTLEREGAEVREWNIQDVSSIEKTMKDCQSVLVLPMPSTELVKETDNLIQAAGKAGIHNVLFWSCLTVKEISESGSGLEKGRRIVKMMKEVEENLLKCKHISNKCIVRLGLPMQTFFFLSDIIQNRSMLPMSTGNGQYAPVNILDVGIASGKILHQGIGQEYNNQILSFTGPQLLTTQQLVNNVNHVLESQIKYEDLSIEELCTILDKLVQEKQMTEFQKDTFLYYNQVIREGKLAVQTHDLQKLLERSPTNVEKFFEENRDAFRPGGRFFSCISADKGCIAAEKKC